MISYIMLQDDGPLTDKDYPKTMYTVRAPDLEWYTITMKD